MNRQTIEKMTIEEKISYLSTRYMLTISQWDDKWRHYRVGLNWKDDSVDFIIEKPTLDLALNDVIEVAIIGVEAWQKINREREIEFMRNVKELIELDLSVNRAGLFRYVELEKLIRKRDPEVPKHVKSSEVAEYLKKYESYNTYHQANSIVV